MVKLTPDQQEMLMAAEPAIFRAVNGTGGLRGYTTVYLPAADATTMKSALAMAWKNVTPLRLHVGTVFDLRQQPDFIATKAANRG